MYGGIHRSRKDRQFVYSRFRPWRTCRDDAAALLTCVTFLGESSQIAAGGHSGELKIFDTNSNNILETCISHNSAVILVQSCQSKETQLVISSSSLDVKLWDATSISAGPIQSFDGCRAARFSHSGSRFAALPTEVSQREILLYDVQTHQLDQKLSDPSSGGSGRGHAYSLVHFSPSDDMLLWNGVLWDRRASGPVHRFDQFTDYGGGGFHPVENEVIINSEVWDLRKFRLLRSLDQTAITFNSRGDVIYAILRRNLDDIMLAVNNRRSKHPLFSAFRTVDAVNYSADSERQSDVSTNDLFLPFRCFCTRKDIQCRDFVLEDTDVPKALIEFVTTNAIEVLIMGATSKGSFLAFSKIDNSSIISKGAPDFCTVYVIAKSGKISSMRSASRSAPSISPLRSQIISQPSSAPTSPPQSRKGSERSTPVGSPLGGEYDELKGFQSPFLRGGRAPHMKSYADLSSDTDISFVSSGRPSVDHMMPSMYSDAGRGNATTNRLSMGSDNMDYMSDYSPYPRKSVDRKSADRRSVDILASPPSNSFFSNTSSDDNFSVNWSNMDSQSMDDVEGEMRRLKLELRQTMDMYNNAFQEAVNAKQKALELQRWKMEEEKRVEDGKNEESSSSSNYSRSNPTVEVAKEAQNRVAELEAQKRISLEMKAINNRTEAERSKMSKALTSSNQDLQCRYRKYTIEEIEIASEYFSESRKIGEGGYGPVYKCYLDHTSVAVKVLRPDAAQGRSQFQQEVEVLSCIRHPNMVLLLGACPEYGCLVYEYMHNGSLEDRLFCRGGTPPLCWQHRFRIAAEIATALLFLHQTKPEPLVHRDLKPANILLDRNLVSKISDVGLARLVPPNIADDVTQYRMTSAAGTFCYIDPEYQQTGMLGVKSDVYSLGVMLLQIVTAKSPMGLTHYVERAIEKGTFRDMLDPNVPDWPIEEAQSYAKMALKCAELRRKDRPDLGTVVLPELCRLRNIAEDSLDAMMFGGGGGGGSGFHGYHPKSYSQVSMQQGLSGPPSHESIH